MENKTSKQRWIDGTKDWFRSPIKETFLLLRYMRNRLLIRWGLLMHRKEMRTIETLTQRAILKHKGFQADFRRAGMNPRQPYQVEVNYHNKSVLVVQNGAEIATSWYNIQSMNQDEVKWGDTAW